MSKTTYTYDEKSLLRNGKRWFPVMGEIHYSRYPNKYWKEALYKMKAGGVNIVSSYVLWIHHEEIENQWDWTGDRNLRKFVETIKECGLSMILRIGPWCHAETRNGGFPDWLLEKCPDARTNDESYFKEVEKLYKEIYAQVKGLLLKDGGPIIGLQIENEYGHCGGLCGAEGEAHMKRLTKMAQEIGFDLPLYTATGWGVAVTAGLLPVMGGYCEAPWDPRITEIEPSGNYIFTYERNDHAIGCDFGLGEGITFDMTKVPYLTAELGGGLQVTYKRRPMAHGRDIGGMSIAKIGSGCNLLGYYMYHGGRNPDGKLTTLEENIKSGSLNDLPVKNYDFRAPLGEYGQPGETYGEIRRLALFVQDYGEELCSMKTYLPEDNPLKPEDLTSLRSSWRYDPETKKGYLFVNNFQRRQKMSSHTTSLLPPEKVLGQNSNKAINVHVEDGDYFFMPFTKDDSDYVYATPLCRLNVSGADVQVLYPLTADCDKDEKNLGLKGDKLFISYKDSLLSSKVKTSAGQEALLVSEGIVYEKSGEEGEYYLAERNSVSFKIFPGLKNDLPGFEKKDDGIFESYTYTGRTDYTYEVQAELLEKTEDLARYKLTLPSWENFENADDVFVKISYTGNCARLYSDGVLIDDHIYGGEDYPWEIGLKPYGNQAHEFVLEIDALKKDAPIFLEKWPDLTEEKTAVLKNISSQIEYRIPLKF